mgnify:CR=1 FL=1
MPDPWGIVLNALNTIFNPILAIDPNPANPALTVLIIAFIVSLITTIANKYLSIVFTNYILFVSTGDKYREKTRNAKINPPLFNNICKATSTR